MSTDRTFETERLQLAIFLHATGRLRFLRCERNGHGKVRFAFDDPERIGPEVELELTEVRPWQPPSCSRHKSFCVGK